MLPLAIVIDNSYKIIKTLEKNCFHNMCNVVCVMLQHNAILTVKSKSFNNLTRLNYVNLSNNPISYLSSNIISSSRKATAISLEHNSMINIDKHVFSGSNIKLLETNNFRLCCLTPFGALCTAYRPWYESFTNLLPIFSIKVTFIIISVFIIFANAFSVIIHLKSMLMSDTFNKIVITVNINDMICGIHISPVWAANFYYGEGYTVIDHRWQSSLVCLLV